MNKTQLSEQLAMRAGIPKIEAQRVTTVFFGVVADALANGEDVVISDFGKFYTSTRKAFTGHHPRTRQPMDVPARCIPVFRPGNALKRRLNG